MALPRSIVAVLLTAALGAPFVLVARAGSALVLPLADASAAALLRITAPLNAAPLAPPPAEAAIEAPDLLAAPAEPKPSRRAPRGAAKGPPPALFVGRAAVLRLAQTAARPQGSFVSQTPVRPAGLQLSGVSGLGIGVQDGDILVEALGISPRTPGDIVGAVIEARSRRAPVLSGTLWRRGQTLRISVEQPY